MAERDVLTALALTVRAFHLTDRAMRAAQDRIERGLAAGDVDAAATQAYLDAVARYFAPFEGEARAQLQHVDRELAKLYQLQFNLTAERAVVAKRVEAVRGVLTALAELRAG